MHLGHDKTSCPKCGSEKTRANKNSISVTGIRKKQMVCGDCGKYFTVSEKVYLAALTIRMELIAAQRNK